MKNLAKYLYNLIITFLNFIKNVITNANKNLEEKEQRKQAQQNELTRQNMVANNSTMFRKVFATAINSLDNLNRLSTHDVNYNALRCDLQNGQWFIALNTDKKLSQAMLQNAKNELKNILKNLFHEYQHNFQDELRIKKYEIQDEQLAYFHQNMDVSADVYNRYFFAYKQFYETHFKYLYEINITNIILDNSELCIYFIVNDGAVRHFHFDYFQFLVNNY